MSHTTSKASILLFTIKFYLKKHYTSEAVSMQPNFSYIASLHYFHHLCQTNKQTKKSQNKQLSIFFFQSHPCPIFEVNLGLLYNLDIYNFLCTTLQLYNEASNLQEKFRFTNLHLTVQSSCVTFLVCLFEEASFTTIFITFFFFFFFPPICLCSRPFSCVSWWWWWWWWWGPYQRLHLPHQ